MPLKERPLRRLRLLHEDLHGLPQPAGGVTGKKAFSQGHSPAGTLLRLLAGRTGPGESGSSLPGRKGKDVKFAEIHLLRHLQSSFKRLGVLAGKSHEKIRAHVHMLPENIPDQRKNIRELPHRIASLHTPQHFIVSALKRNMKMRAELSCIPKHCKKCRGYGEGLQRTKTDTPDPGYTAYLLHQSSQGLSIFGSSVTPEMNSRENDFSASSRGEPANLLQDILFRAAYGFSPKMGDNAVGAEMIASVLDLHESPGMPEKAEKPQFIPGIPALGRPLELMVLLQGFSAEKGFRKVRDSMLDTVPHHEVRFGKGFFMAQKVLGIATAENASASRRLPEETAEKSAAFAFRHGGDGTGKENSQIPGGFRHHLPSSFEEHGAQSLRLVLVGSASQGLKRYPEGPSFPTHPECILPGQG
jgi:hypothetical protein